MWHFIPKHGARARLSRRVFPENRVYPAVEELEERNVLTTSATNPLAAAVVTNPGSLTSAPVFATPPASVGTAGAAPGQPGTGFQPSATVPLGSGSPTVTTAPGFGTAVTNTGVVTNGATPALGTALANTGFVPAFAPVPGVLSGSISPVPGPPLFATLPGQSPATAAFPFSANDPRITNPQSAAFFPTPTSSALPPEALTSSRLNATSINGAIYPVGTMQDQTYLMTPTPFARLAGQTGNPVRVEPALSGTRIGFGESFRGSNDGFQTGIDGGRTLFVFGLGLAQAGNEDSPPETPLETATDEILAELAAMLI